MKKIVITAVCAAAMLLVLPVQAAPVLQKQQVWREQRDGEGTMVSQVYSGCFSPEKTTLLSAEYFERRLQLLSGDLKALRFTVLPQEGGTLVLDGVAVEQNEMLSRKELDRLCFVPKGEPGNSCWFSVVPRCSRSVVATICVQLQEPETVQIDNDVCTTMKNVSVRRSVRLNGSAIDIPLEEEILTVDTPPKKGMLTLCGTEYIYTPYPNQSGKDHFVLSAGDPRGAVTDKAVITVKIDREEPEHIFLDMQGSPSEYAALRLRESGVMSGESTGDIRLFCPQKQVTAGEFLVMVMQTIGEGEDLPNCVSTDLENDSELPLWLKPYVKKAQELGIWNERTFEPQQVMTCAQAVCLLRRAAEVEDVFYFQLNSKEREEIPAWAMSSYMAMGANGLLLGNAQQAEPLANLTRDTAADLLLPLLEWKAEK